MIVSFGTLDPLYNHLKLRMICNKHDLNMWPYRFRKLTQSHSLKSIYADALMSQEYNYINKPSSSSRLHPKINQTKDFQIIEENWSWELSFGHMARSSNTLNPYENKHFAIWPFIVVH